MSKRKAITKLARAIGATYLATGGKGAQWTAAVAVFAKVLR